MGLRCLVSFAAVAACVMPLCAQLRVVLDFETGDYSQIRLNVSKWWGACGESWKDAVFCDYENAPDWRKPCARRSIDAGCACECGEGTSLRVTTEQARRGTYSSRHRVTECNERAEIFFSGGTFPPEVDNSVYGAAREETWYGWSIYVPQNYAPPDNVDYTVITQWHSHSPGTIVADCKTHLSMLDDYTLHFFNSYEDPPGVKALRDSVLNAKIIPGQWNDFVLHAKFTHLDDGFLVMYKDGEVVYEIRDVATWPDQPWGPKLTFGEYRYGGPSCTYDDVAPETGGPPDTSPPSAPSDIRVREVTDSSARIAWTASTDNTGIGQYWLYVDGEFHSRISGDSAAAALDDLVKGTRYGVSVIALDESFNKSPFTNVPTRTARAKVQVMPWTVTLFCSGRSASGGVRALTGKNAAANAVASG